MRLFSFNKIKYLRRKLKNKNWVKNRINLLFKFSEELNTFYMFECSDFFRGYTVAENNRKYFYKRDRQIDRQLKFLQKYGDRKN